jgi:hypothetical protein
LSQYAVWINLLPIAAANHRSETCERVICHGWPAVNGPTAIIDLHVRRRAHLIRKPLSEAAVTGFNI